MAASAIEAHNATIKEINRNRSTVFHLVSSFFIGIRIEVIPDYRPIDEVDVGSL